jgi:hypothetical protein
MRYGLLLVLFFFGCKKDDPYAAIEPLVGKWEWVATQEADQEDWTMVGVDTNRVILSFRSDGLILDSSGTPPCCAPSAYILNGKPFNIEPKFPVEANRMCELVNCISCEFWDIKQSGDEIVVSFCTPGGNRYKYRRI